MRLVGTALFLSVALGSRVYAQLTPELEKGLISTDFLERYDAFEAISSAATLSPQAKTALVQLLIREDGVIQEFNREGLYPGDKFGEGYGQYVGRLNAVVGRLAEEEPDRADVWLAEMYAPYNSETEFTVHWLPKYGDKAAPILMAQLSDPHYREHHPQIFDALAHIVDYERRASKKKIKEEDLQKIEATIRTAVSDENPGIRSAGVKALSIVGGREDLALLEGVSLTDPDVNTHAGRTEAEIRFFVREDAAKALQRLRSRLARETAPGK